MAKNNRVAHRPMLAPQGLDARKVKKGEGFMLYFIDAAKNHSKFYEGLMLPNNDGSGTHRVLLRWGALTDSGFTGRVDGAKFDPRQSNLSEREARALLMKKYNAKTRKGYVDAWKHKLPKGQYPVGLKRDVGFGWGVQDAAFCTVELGQIRGYLSNARDSVTRNPHAVEMAIEQAISANEKLMRADSTMGAKIIKNLRQLKERSLNFTNGLDTARNMATALSRLISYIDKQLSVCHSKAAAFHRRASLAEFDPTEIGEIKKPYGDPDEMRHVENMDQRRFHEVRREYPSDGDIWDGTGYQTKRAMARLAGRYRAAYEKPRHLIFSDKAKAQAFVKSLDKNEVTGKFSVRKTKGWKTYSVVFTPNSYGDVVAIMKQYKPEKKHFKDIAKDVEG